MYTLSHYIFQKHVGVIVFEMQSKHLYLFFGLSKDEKKANMSAKRRNKRKIKAEKCPLFKNQKYR